MAHSFPTRGSATGSRNGQRGRGRGEALDAGRGDAGRGDARGGDSWVDASSPGTADPAARARDLCLRQLALAPRTRSQLAERLAARDIPAEVAETVLDRFTEVGLIDDAAYAEAWVRSRSRSQGHGLARRVLTQELRRRGIADDLVDRSTAALDGDTERATARRIVDRRLMATRALEPATRARRLAGMLARKGYSAGMAFAVVREALRAEAANDYADADGTQDELAGADGA